MLFKFPNSDSMQEITKQRKPEDDPMILGAGAEATSIKIEFENDQKFYVLKKLNNIKSRDFLIFIKEFTISNKIQCDFIRRAYGYQIYEDYPSLILEYCDNSLDQLEKMKEISFNPKNQPDPQILLRQLIICTTLFEALKCLQSHLLAFTQHDLKPDNILYSQFKTKLPNLSPNEEWTLYKIKLSDFGCAKQTAIETQLNGSRRYKMTGSKAYNETIEIGGVILLLYEAFDPSAKMYELKLVKNKQTLITYSKVDAPLIGLNRFFDKHLKIAYQDIFDYESGTFNSQIYDIMHTLTTEEIKDYLKDYFNDKNELEKFYSDYIQVLKKLKIIVDYKGTSDFQAIAPKIYGEGFNYEIFLDRLFHCYGYELKIEDIKKYQDEIINLYTQFHKYPIRLMNKVAQYHKDINFLNLESVFKDFHDLFEPNKPESFGSDNSTTDDPEYTTYAKLFLILLHQDFSNSRCLTNFANAINFITYGINLSHQFDLEMFFGKNWKKKYMYFMKIAELVNIQKYNDSPEYYESSMKEVHENFINLYTNNSTFEDIYKKYFDMFDISQNMNYSQLAFDIYQAPFNDINIINNINNIINQNIINQNITFKDLLAEKQIELEDLKMIGSFGRPDIFDHDQFKDAYGPDFHYCLLLLSISKYQNDTASFVFDFTIFLEPDNKDYFVCNYDLLKYKSLINNILCQETKEKLFPSFLLEIDKTLFMKFINDIFKFVDPISKVSDFFGFLATFQESNKNDSPETLNIIQELLKPLKLVAYNYSNTAYYSEFWKLMIDNFSLTIFESSIKEIVDKMVREIEKTRSPSEKNTIQQLLIEHARLQNVEGGFRDKVVNYYWIEEIKEIDSYFFNELENNLLPNAKKLFENERPQKYIFNLINKFYQALIAFFNNESTITSLIGKMKNKILKLLENFDLPQKGTNNRRYEAATKSIEAKLNEEITKVFGKSIKEYLTSIIDNNTNLLDQKSLQFPNSDSFMQEITQQIEQPNTGLTLLGKGSEADSYKMKFANDQKFYVLKKLKNSECRDFLIFIKEFIISNKIKCDFIRRAYGYHQSRNQKNLEKIQDQTSLILEYCDSSLQQLSNLSFEFDKKNPENHTILLQQLIICATLFEAIKCLQSHSLPFTQHDLKPENILYSEFLIKSDSLILYKIKLSDFGCAKQNSSQTYDIGAKCNKMMGSKAYNETTEIGGVLLLLYKFFNRKPKQSEFQVPIDNGMKVSYQTIAKVPLIGLNKFFDKHLKIAYQDIFDYELGSFNSQIYDILHTLTTEEIKDYLKDYFNDKNELEKFYSDYIQVLKELKIIVDYKGTSDFQAIAPKIYGEGFNYEIFLDRLFHCFCYELKIEDIKKYQDDIINLYTQFHKYPVRLMNKVAQYHKDINFLNLKSVFKDFHDLFEPNKQESFDSDNSTTDDPEYTTYAKLFLILLHQDYSNSRCLTNFANAINFITYGINLSQQFDLEMLFGQDWKKKYMYFMKIAELVNIQKYNDSPERYKSSMAKIHEYFINHYNNGSTFEEIYDNYFKELNISCTINYSQLAFAIYQTPFDYINLVLLNKIQIELPDLKTIGPFNRPDIFDHNEFKDAYGPDFHYCLLLLSISKYQNYPASFVFDFTIFLEPDNKDYFVCNYDLLKYKSLINNILCQETKEKLFPSFLLEIDKTFFIERVNTILNLNKAFEFHEVLTTFQKTFNNGGIRAFAQFQNDLYTFLNNNKLLNEETTKPTTLDIIQELGIFDYSNAAAYCVFCTKMNFAFSQSIIDSVIDEIYLYLIDQIQTLEQSLLELTQSVEGVSRNQVLNHLWIEEIKNISCYLSNEKLDIEDHILSIANKYFQKRYPHKAIFDFFNILYQELFDPSKIHNIVDRMKNNIRSKLENGTESALPAKGTTLFLQLSKMSESIEKEETVIVRNLQNAYNSIFQAPFRKLDRLIEDIYTQISDNDNQIYLLKQKSLDLFQFDDVWLSNYICSNKIYEYDGRKFEFIENNPFNLYPKELFDNEFIKPFLLIPEEIKHNNKSYFFYETTGIKPISSDSKEEDSLHLNPTECTTVAYGLLATLAFLSNLPEKLPLQLKDNVFIYDDGKEKMVKLRLQKTTSSDSDETLIQQFAGILLNLADEKPTTDNFFSRNSWLYYRLIAIQKDPNDNPSFTSLYNDFMSQYRDFMLPINFTYTGTDEVKFKEFRKKYLDKYECLTQKAFINTLYTYFGFHGQFKLIYMFSSLNRNPTTNTPEAFIKAMQNSDTDLITAYFTENPYEFDLNKPDHPLGLHYEEIIAEIERYHMIKLDNNRDYNLLNREPAKLLNFTPFLSPIFYFILITFYPKTEHFKSYEKLRTQFYCTGKGKSITETNIPSEIRSQNSEFWTCKINGETSSTEYLIKRPKFNAGDHSDYYFFFFYRPIRLLYVLNLSSDNYLTEQIGIYQSAVIMKIYEMDLQKFRQEMTKNTKNNTLNPSQCEIIMRLIFFGFLAISKLHSMQFVHCDIKPSNFFVKHINGEARAYLGDLISIIDASIQEKTTTRTRHYCPITFQLDDQTYKRDNFAYGITIIELITGESLGISDNQGKNDIENAIDNKLKEITKKYDISFEDTLREMCILNTSQYRNDKDLTNSFLRAIFSPNSGQVYLVPKGDPKSNKESQSQMIKDYIKKIDPSFDINSIIEESIEDTEKFTKVITALGSTPTYWDNFESKNVVQYARQNKDSVQHCVQILDDKIAANKPLLSFQRLIIFGYREDYISSAIRFFADNKDLKNLRSMANLLYDNNQYEMAWSFYQYLAKQSLENYDNYDVYFDIHLRYFDCSLHLVDKYNVSDVLKDLFVFMIQQAKNSERIDSLINILKRNEQKKQKAITVLRNLHKTKPNENESLMNKFNELQW